MFRPVRAQRGCRRGVARALAGPILRGTAPLLATLFGLAACDIATFGLTDDTPFAAAGAPSGAGGTGPALGGTGPSPGGAAGSDASGGVALAGPGSIWDPFTEPFAVSIPGVAALSLEPLSSLLCGDGVRDPVTEECDDGGDLEPLDLCTATCQVEDALVAVQDLGGNTAPWDTRALLGRRLGAGRHPVAAGPAGFAVAYVEEPAPGAPPPTSGTGGAAAAEPFVGVALYDFAAPHALGTPLADRDPHPLVDASAGTHPVLFAEPAVTGLADGSFAVAFTTVGDDGDALGVALRRLTPLPSASPAVGAVAYAAAEPFASQYDADLLALPDGRLLVAWTDDRDPIAGPDLYYRYFSTGTEGSGTGGAASTSPLEPQGELDLALADTLEAEGRVALAAFDDGWAAAWRSSASDEYEVSNGREVIQVQLDDGTSFTVLEPTPGGALDAFLPGPAGDRPALVQVSPQHLLVLFTVGTDPNAIGVADVGRLRLALCDLAAPGSVPSFLVPFSEALNSDPMRAQAQPAAAVVGDPTNGVLTAPELAGQLFLAWTTAAEPGDPLGADGRAPGEEVWLKPAWIEPATAGSQHVFELGGVSLALVLGDELRLPRWAAGSGADQRTAGLAAAADFASQSPPYDFSGALVAAWEDFGREHGVFEAEPDVVVQFSPLPLLDRTAERTGDCSPEIPCTVGDGHCSSNTECSSGLVCVSPPTASTGSTTPAGPFSPYGLGPQYGLGPEFNVCAPAHCANGTQDSPNQPTAPDHEAGIDCGGDCGDCLVCGDGVTQWMVGEVCDDGNVLPGDGCSADCRSNETCRNGIQDIATGEGCDDGNAINDDFCSNACQLPFCGDGIRNKDEQCDTGGLFTIACDRDCTAPACGDWIVNPAAGEGCELPGVDGCSADCKVPAATCTDPASCLHVRSMPDTVGNNELRVFLRVFNASAATISLQGYHLRYWAANDTCLLSDPRCGPVASGCTGACSAASVTTLQPTRSRSDYVIEAELLPASVTPGSAVELELHMTEAEWVKIFETNDFSYLATANLVPNPHIALYDSSGEIVWGTEPGAAVCGDGAIDPGETCDASIATAECDADCTPAVCGDLNVNPAAGELCDLGNESPACTRLCEPSFCGDGFVNLAAGEVCDAFLSPSCQTPACDGFQPGRGCTNGNVCLKVESQPADGPNDDQIAPYLRLVNNGPDRVDVADLTVRYWFTADEQSLPTVTLDCLYLDGESCGTEVAAVHSLTNPVDGADAYYELSLPASRAALDQGRSIELKTAFHLPAGGPVFDESDDYSYQPSAAYLTNPHITLYRDGELVWGEQPGPAPYCGDFAIQFPEDCDDGSESALCDADCSSPVCGDGYVNALAGEICDPGSSSKCLADCSGEMPGDQGCTDSTSCLHVRSHLMSGDLPGDSQLFPFLQLDNPTAEAVPLSELAVRYWFRATIADPMAPDCRSGPLLATYCVWAALDEALTDNVCGTKASTTFALLSLPRTGASHYLELTFPGAPSLAPGHRTNDLQLRANTCDLSPFDETGDWSWLNTLTYAVNPHVTIYRNGVLTWGIEP